MRGTYFLEKVEEDTCRDTECKRPRERHSLPRDGRGRHLSRHGRKRQARALTPWRPQTEAFVKRRKGREQARGAHFLETIDKGTCSGHGKTEIARERYSHPETTEGRTCQNAERKRPNKALTAWREEREGLVRTWK